MSRLACPAEGCPGDAVRAAGEVMAVCPYGHHTMGFIPPPRWAGKCPDGAHRGTAGELGDGLWWCRGEGNGNAAHYLVAERPAGRLTHFSPSSYATFRSCPRQFHAENLLRRRAPSNVDAVRGTFVHRVLELAADEPDGRRHAATGPIANELWRTVNADGYSGADRDTSRLCADYAQLRLDRDGRARFAGEAKAAIARAAEIAPLDGADIVATEQRFEGVEVGGVPFNGIIDRVDDEDGGLLVNDYKTGSYPSAGKPEWEAEKIAEKLVQPAIYVEAAKQLYGAERVVAQLTFLGPDPGILFADPAQQRTVKSDIRRAWLRAKDMDAEGWWPANPGPLCGWCPHLAWRTADGTVDFCAEGLTVARAKMATRWGWTRFETGEPVPGAVLIESLTVDERAEAWSLADRCGGGPGPETDVSH